MDKSAFDKKLAALNELIYFDDNAYLREKTTNPTKLKQLIAEAKSMLPENEAHTYYLCGIIGNLYRICEEPQEAIHYLQQCLTIAIEESNPEKEIVSLIRLGEAFKYANEHQHALALFNSALTKCDAHHVYLDFILQHKGKCLMELGHLEETEACFVQALKIRQQKAEPSPMHSTELALALLKRLKMKH